MHLIAAQFKKYEILSNSSAGSLFDESIKKLLKLTVQIKHSVELFKESAETFLKVIQDQEKLASDGDPAVQERVANELKSKYIVFAQDIKQATGESESSTNMLIQYDTTLQNVRDELIKSIEMLKEKNEKLENDEFTYN